MTGKQVFSSQRNVKGMFGFTEKKSRDLETVIVVEDLSLPQKQEALVS